MSRSEKGVLVSTLGLESRRRPDPGTGTGSSLTADKVSAWFGSNKVLDRVSLEMPARTVTALIGPSGCGKSTFLRILNRMHESVPSAKLAGEVRLNGQDIYAAGSRITTTRKRIGMVFQKPNPFPAMSIADNVTAGLKLTGTRASRSEKAASDRALPVPGRALGRGQGPPVATGLGPVRWSAAAPVHRPLAGGQPGRAADGRTVLGAGPDLDLPDRTDDHRAGSRGHHRHRHPQHAAGGPGFPAMCLLPGQSGHARLDRGGR